MVTVITIQIVIPAVLGHIFPISGEIFAFLKPFFECLVCGPIKILTPAVLSLVVHLSGGLASLNIQAFVEIFYVHMCKTSE